MILVAYRHGFRPAELVDLISPTAVSIVIMKIPERPRNPDFPAPEGPIFTRLRAPVDQSKELLISLQPRPSSY
jgi:hypothetical protein